MSEKGRCDVCAAPCSSCVHMEFSGGDTSVLSTDDSDIDVKVCDICGDAGREDMLAICSRCSDGAEHTYCMRKMLKKVPSANWLCEDCKVAPPPPKKLSRDSSFNRRSQTHNATLLKSKSFNASKLKLADEVRPKDISRTLQKSMSLKSAPDSKVKMLSPTILSSKGSRSLKERHFDRKTFSLNTSAEPTPRTESTAASFSSNTKSKPTAKLAGGASSDHKFKEEASEKPSNSSSVDGSSVRSRSTSKSTFCQKCKEIGHSAEFCASEATGAAKSVREDSKLKEAIHAALLRKPEIQRKKRSDENCTDHDQAKLSLAAVNHGLKMLAIPEYDYVWRGCFEMSRSGGSSVDLCGGVQAHLSSCASARVPEVVRRFPQRLCLEQVPRLAAWPTHFHDRGGAKEDNIALYFFAKDLDSYDRNYKSLLDGMIKNDLALKGNFEGVELLIFPSNQLPESSQRWNTLYFLWGVFRARRVHNSETDSTTKPNVVNERAVAVDKKLVDGGCDTSDIPKKSEALSSVLKDEIKWESDANLRCAVRGKSPPLDCDGAVKREVEVEGEKSWRGVESKTKECLLVEKNVLCEEKVIAEDLGNVGPEMRLFPNLELALGAETKQSKGANMLPFLVGPGPVPIKEQVEEEDEASLSLSLSFPTTRRR